MQGVPDFSMFPPAVSVALILIWIVCRVLPDVLRFATVRKRTVGTRV